jgi:hypothetical protein
MHVVYRRHQEAPAAKVGFQASSGNQRGLLVDLSSSGLQREDGFHFHDCEARDQMLGIPLGLKPGDQVAANLQAVKLGQCAGVKVISGQSALSPFFENGLR